MIVMLRFLSSSIPLIFHNSLVLAVRRKLIIDNERRETTSSGLIRPPPSDFQQEGPTQPGLKVTVDCLPLIPFSCG